jgi:hypothetical protein
MINNFRKIEDLYNLIDRLIRLVLTLPVSTATPPPSKGWLPPAATPFISHFFKIYIRFNIFLLNYYLRAFLSLNKI